jgi:hypothetical protein
VLSVVLGAAGLLGTAAIARADLTITPTWDTTITSDPNAGTIEAGIEATISRVEADIANNVTVKIKFEETTTGLGASGTPQYHESFSTYVNQLKTDQTQSFDDRVAISSLPSAVSAVNGNASAQVNLTGPLSRALGVSNNPSLDGTIYLNTSIMNISRTGTQNSGDYDLQAVAGHEIDEVLGIGGDGSAVSATPTNISPLDLYRYTAAGVRSFSTSESIAPYFSLNGGVTDFVHFNQYTGADYGDWGNGAIPAAGRGNNPPNMQDAFGTPGKDLNIGQYELAALDAEGWTLTSAGAASEALAPEPSAAMLLPILALGFLVRRPQRA